MVIGNKEKCTRPGCKGFMEKDFSTDEETCDTCLLPRPQGGKVEPTGFRPDKKPNHSQRMPPPVPDGRISVEDFAEGAEVISDILNKRTIVAEYDIVEKPSATGKRHYNKKNKAFWGENGKKPVKVERPAIGKAPKPDSKLITEMLIAAEYSGYRRAMELVYGGKDGNKH